MESPIQYLDFQRFKKICAGTGVSEIGDDLLIADIRYSSALRLLDYPCRIDAYLALFCLRGNVTIDINLNSYEIKANTVMVSVPGNIVRVSKFDVQEIEDMRFFLFAVSKEFMSNIKIDLGKLFQKSMSVLEDPCVTLSRTSRKICQKYVSLTIYILGSKDIPDKKEAVGALITSILYVLGAIWQRRITQHSSDLPAQSTKAKITFDRFMKLVSDHHTKERNMAFYASELGLTPKYLSKLVKGVSGRSAPDWVDSFVILEAKNMLKYSDISIKEIVFKLNFPSQSVFYKFFKAHTGQTPSEYRNS